MSCALGIEKMRIQQFSLVHFVALFFSYVVPLLGKMSVKEKLERAQKFIEKTKIPPETRLVHTENILFDSTELVAAWNKKFPENPIAVPTTAKKIEIVGLAVPFGEKLTSDYLVSSIFKFKGKMDEFVQEYKTLIEGAIKKTESLFKEHSFNVALGYLSYQNIYFLPSERNAIEELLKKYFLGIYGLPNDISEDEAMFSNALKVVFGESGNLIFEKIPCDPIENNLQNFEEYLEEVPTDPISEGETDLKLKALKAAIDAYKTAKTAANLEKVKEEWLRQLQGNTTFPVKEEPSKPKSKGAIVPVSILIKSEDDLAVLDEQEINDNLTEQKEEPTPDEKKSSFPTWAIWLLGGVSFFIVGGIAFVLMKKKSSKY